MTAKSLRIIFALLAISLLSCGLRLYSWQNFANPEGGFFFYSIDAYDHLRRIILGTLSFPSVPVHDYYVGFPEGTGLLWSPLFDYLFSTFFKLFDAKSNTIEAVCFFTSPMLVTTTLLAFFCLALRLFGNTASALSATLLFGLSPAYVAYSLPMNFDHHYIEPLIVLTLFFLSLRGEMPQKRLLRMVTTALALPAAIAFWRGATLYWGLHFFGNLVLCLFFKDKLRATEQLISYLGAAAILSLYCLVDPFQNASQFSFNIVSWFHVLLLGLATIFFFLYRISASNRQFFIITALLSGAAVSMHFFLAGPALLSQVRSGFSLIKGSGDAWLEANRELKGVFSIGYPFWYSATYLTLSWFLAPFAVAIGLRQVQQLRQPNILLFLCWSPLLVLGFVIRYSHSAALYAALCSGFLLLFFRQKQTDLPRTVLTLALPLVILLLALPHYRNTLSLSLPAPIREGLVGSRGVLSWIRDNTPPTSHYFTSAQTPEYGILAPWDLGARIYYHARRPALATAFGWETHGFYEQAAFMATAEAQKAEAIAAANKIRYVLLRAFQSSKADHAIALQGERKGQIMKGTVTAFEPTNTVYQRLMYHDGTAHQNNRQIIDAIAGFRLLFESEYLAKDNLSYYKLFEAVPGAELSGKCSPNSLVTAKITLLSSRNRTFAFETFCRADSTGAFSVRVPYATGIKQGETRPLSLFEINDGLGYRRQVGVSEEEIREGRKIRID